MSIKYLASMYLILFNLVNYSHLKEGASCFTETTCIKVSINVEDVSPQALISVVPTVLYTTFQFIPYLKEGDFLQIFIKRPILYSHTA